MQQSSTFKLKNILLCSDSYPLQKYFRDRASITFVDQEPKKGKPDALNKLLDQATSIYCIQNSADCVPASPDTYHILLTPLLKPSVGAVTSQPVPTNEGFMHLPNIVWKMHNFVQPKLSAELFAFKRHAVTHLPVDVIHDDAYIHAMINSQNLEVVYEPNAIVLNAAPERCIEYYAQRKKNVVGNVQLAKQFNIDASSKLRIQALILLSIELIANIHGRLDYVRGKVPKGLVGYNLETTKNTCTRI